MLVLCRERNWQKINSNSKKIKWNIFHLLKLHTHLLDRHSKYENSIWNHSIVSFYFSLPFVRAKQVYLKRTLIQINVCAFFEYRTCWLISSPEFLKKKEKTKKFKYFLETDLLEICERWRYFFLSACTFDCYSFDDFPSNCISEQSKFLILENKKTKS